MGALTSLFLRKGSTRPVAKARLLYSSEFFVQEVPGFGGEGTDLAQKKVSQVCEELGQLLTELMYPGVSQKQGSDPDPTSGASCSRVQWMTLSRAARNNGHLSFQEAFLQIDLGSPTVQVAVPSL